MSLISVLNKYGQIGVKVLKQAIAPIDATGKTQASIRYVVDGEDSLKLIGRAFFHAIETGRGPRRSDEDMGFKDNMLEYMKARGIGADLSEKKREQLEKFLVLKINKEGDSTYKKGGRVIYSDVMETFKKELVDEIKKDFGLTIKEQLKQTFKNGT